MAIMLNHLYMFDGLSDTALEKIESIAELESYAPGAKIFSQGDTADAMYMIQHGSVIISIKEDDGKDVEISKLGTGSHFGEMSMLDEDPRSATVISEGHSDIIQLSYKSMHDLLESDVDIAIHFYREISRFLCSRLRLTSLDFSNLRNQNTG